MKSQEYDLVCLPQDPNVVSVSLRCKIQRCPLLGIETLKVLDSHTVCWLKGLCPRMGPILLGQHPGAGKNSCSGLWMLEPGREFCVARDTVLVTMCWASHFAALLPQPCRILLSNRPSRVGWQPTKDQLQLFIRSRARSQVIAGYTGSFQIRTKFMYLESRHLHPSIRTVRVYSLS